MSEDSEAVIEVRQLGRHIEEITGHDLEIFYAVNDGQRWEIAMSDALGREYRFSSLAEFEAWMVEQRQSDWKGIDELKASR